VKRPVYRKGRYYYPLRCYSLLRVLSFERFTHYLLRAPAGDVVLDYGAGDRPYEEMLHKKYRRYIAADHVATHENYCGGRPDILLNDAPLPLESASVDCVILTEVLEHVFDPRAALADLRRVLKPGGILCGTVPFAIQHHDEPYDYHRYTYYCLERMFRETGFEVEALDYVGDMVGVCLSTAATIGEAIPRALAKLHLGILAAGLRILFRLPLFAYYYGCKAGLNPAKLRYFKRYPLGFSFQMRKPLVEAVAVHT
jgi:SAM-dependent methyltransferase